MRTDSLSVPSHNYELDCARQAFVPFLSTEDGTYACVYPPSGDFQK